jgi:hypothetical protein
MKIKPKKVIIFLLCVLLCAGAGAVFLFYRKGGGETYPSLTDAIATFHRHGAEIYPDRDFSEEAKRAGALNAVIFTMDGEEAALYSFESQEDLRRFREADPEAKKGSAVRGLILLRTASQRAVGVFTLTEVGAALLWPSRVPGRGIQIVGSYSASGLCEFTFDGTARGPDALDGRFPATDGHFYLELRFTVTNTGGQAFDIADLMWARFYAGDGIFQGTPYVYEAREDAWHSAYPIEPGAAQSVTVIVPLPESAAAESLEADIVIGDTYFSYTGATE